jgi:hypothetical protein
LKLNHHPEMVGLYVGLLELPLPGSPLVHPMSFRMGSGSSAYQLSEEEVVSFSGVFTQVGVPKQ